MNNKIEIKVISMDDPLYQNERMLRNDVLLRPIGLADHAWEMFDEECLHMIALFNNEVVGCVLLHTKAEDKSGKLMQMAVNSQYQRQGIGKNMVTCLLKEAGQMGLTSVYCHSRDTATLFYQGLGFSKVGRPFTEVGVSHLKMKIDLQLKN